MEQDSPTKDAADTKLFAGKAWFDPSRPGVRPERRLDDNARVQRQSSLSAGDD